MAHPRPRARSPPSVLEQRDATPEAAAINDCSMRKARAMPRPFGTDNDQGEVPDRRVGCGGSRGPHRRRPTNLTDHWQSANDRVQLASWAELNKRLCEVLMRPATIVDNWPPPGRCRWRARRHYDRSRTCLWVPRVGDNCEWSTSR